MCAQGTKVQQCTNMTGLEALPTTRTLNDQVRACARVRARMCVCSNAQAFACACVSAHAPARLLLFLPLSSGPCPQILSLSSAARPPIQPTARTHALTLTQVRAICEARPGAERCMECTESWAANKTWADCDLLTIYGGLCNGAPSERRGARAGASFSVRRARVGVCACAAR
jgi:hypothetical protein